MKQVLRVRFEPAHENLINKLGQGREQKMFFLQASLRKGVSPKERAERNEAAINSGHSFCSYSIVSKKTCLGPCRILGPASRIGTNGIFCTNHGKLVSTYIFGGVHLHKNNLLFVPVRSGRSVVPNKRKGCNTSSSS